MSEVSGGVQLSSPTAPSAFWRGCERRQVVAAMMVKREGVPRSPPNELLALNFVAFGSSVRLVISSHVICTRQLERTFRGDTAMAGGGSRPGRELMSFVGRMYDAAVSPILWDGILEDLARQFRSEFAILTMHDRTNFEVVFNSYYNIEHWATIEWAAVARYDPMAPMMYHKTNRVEHCRAINSTEEIHSSVFYMRLMQPHGIEFRMGVHCDVNGPVGASLAVLRSPENRSYNEIDKRRFGSLVPHFARAMRIQHLLSGSFAAADMLKEIIDSLPFSVVLVDAQLRLLFSNRAATSLADQRRGISLRHTMLYAGDDLSNRHLRRAVGLVISDKSCSRHAASTGWAAPAQPLDHFARRWIGRPFWRRGAGRDFHHGP